MTKVLVLDDGCHEIEVIVDCEDARILPKWDNIPTAELNAEAAELGYEEFINKYCKFEGADEFFAVLDAIQQ